MRIEGSIDSNLVSGKSRGSEGARDDAIVRTKGHPDWRTILEVQVSTKKILRGRRREWIDEWS